MIIAQLSLTGIVFYRAALLWCLLLWSGCALIPEGEQFVAGTKGDVQLRENGSCGQQLPKSDWPDAAAPALSPERISVLNWNAYKGRKRDWHDDFLLFSKQKDIILLQEAPLNEELLDVFEHGAFSWLFNSAFKYRGIEAGVVLASWVPPLERCGERTLEPLIRLPKTSVVARYPLGGMDQTLLVANIHGINITLGLSAYRQQFTALGALLHGHDGPLILAGDFNDWTKGRRTIVQALVAELGLAPLMTESGGRSTVFGEPVDHILYRGLAPVDFLVHKVESSDHRPIEVVFQVQP